MTGFALVRDIDLSLWWVHLISRSGRIHETSCVNRVVWTLGGVGHSVGTVCLFEARDDPAPHVSDRIETLAVFISEHSADNGTSSGSGKWGSLSTHILAFWDKRRQNMSHSVLLELHIHTKLLEEITSWFSGWWEDQRVIFTSLDIKLLTSECTSSWHIR